MKTKSLFLVPLLMLGACGPKEDSAYVPKEIEDVQPLVLSSVDPKSLMPLQKGAEWTYNAEVIQRQGTIETETAHEVRLVITDVKEIENGVEATVDGYLDGVRTQTQKWIRTDDGFFQQAITTGGETIAFSTPQPMIPFPLSVGETIKWSGSGKLPSGGSGDINMELKVLDSQVVDTTMGRMAAVPVETALDFMHEGKPAGTESTGWLKPDVGLVRQVERLVYDGGELTQILKLKRYSLE